MEKSYFKAFQGQIVLQGLREIAKESAMMKSIKALKGVKKVILFTHEGELAE